MWTVRVRGPLGPLLAFASRFSIQDVEVREAHLEEVLKAYYKDEVSAS